MLVILFDIALSKSSKWSFGINVFASCASGGVAVMTVEAPGKMIERLHMVLHSLKSSTVNVLIIRSDKRSVPLISRLHRDNPIRIRRAVCE